MMLKPNLFMDFYNKKQKLESSKTKGFEYMEFTGYTAM